MEARSKVVIGLLYSLNHRKAEMFIQFALDQRPRPRDRAHAVVKDNFRFRRCWLETAQLSIALEQNLDAFEVTGNRSDLPGVKLPVATLYLTSPNRFIGAVVGNHIDFERANGITIGQRCQPTGSQILCLCDHVSFVRNPERLIVPDLVAVALTKTFPKGIFEDAPVALVGRTDDARRSRVARSGYRVLNKLHFGQCADGVINHRRDPFHKGHYPYPRCHLASDEINIFYSQRVISRCALAALRSASRSRAKPRAGNARGGTLATRLALDAGDRVTPCNRGTVAYKRQCRILSAPRASSVGSSGCGISAVGQRYWSGSTA